MQGGGHIAGVADETPCSMLRDDGTESGKHSFEGTFSWAGNEHTIQLPLNYLTSRQNGDPAISRRSVDRGTPIVHRRSDIMTTLEARSAGIEVRDGSLECSADSHEFNSQNRLFLTESNNDNASTSPLSFFVAPPKQARRSLFPFIRDSATEMLSTRRSPVPPTAGAETFSYERATLSRRQGGGDLMGGSNNDSFTADIGSTSGCPSSAQAMYMGVASDCTYTGRFSNSSGAREQILNNMNSVSDIYRRTFRVSLGVVELEIREAANCPTTASGDEAWNVNCDGASLDSRLSSFSQWRGNNAANGTGLWHLLTTCASGQEVGVAWLGTLCQTEATSQGSDVISGTGVSAATQQEAQVMAHEIGHNFGAIHDCISGCSLQGVSAMQNGGAVCCPQSTTSCNSNGAFIMSPVSQADTDTFSPCSIGNICTMLGTGLNTTCISDPNVNPRETLSVQQCGNGIREPGEECDAGPNGSSCCSANCTLTSGSVCDPESSVCCTDSCQFAPTTTVCRPAVDERCDTAETCSGSSDVCPTDVRKDDGSSCASGLTCASGHCTSRDLQCQQQSQANMDFTTACPVSADNSCSVSCENPSSSSSCLILQQNFIDGTECGYGGTCEGGACQSGSWQATFQAWYRNNLRISIPVTIVIGLLILAILYGLGRCLYNRMRGGRSHKASGGAAVLPGRRRGNRSSQQPYRGPPPPTHPNSYQPQYQQQQGQWVDPNAYNGPARGGYPSY